MLDSRVVVVITVLSQDVALKHSPSFCLGRFEYDTLPYTGFLELPPCPNNEPPDSSSLTMHAANITLLSIDIYMCVYIYIFWGPFVVKRVGRCIRRGISAGLSICISEVCQGQKLANDVQSPTLSYATR